MRTMPLFTALLALSALAGPAPDRESARFARCGAAPRVTCVVDGDTFWYRGAKIRIADINTPETTRPACPREAALGEAASARLAELLNLGPFTLAPVEPRPRPLRPPVAHRDAARREPRRGAGPRRAGGGVARPPRQLVLSGRAGGRANGPNVRTRARQIGGPAGVVGDRYGRLLRTVTRRGQSLGATLVREGLAEEWQGRRGSWC